MALLSINEEKEKDHVDISVQDADKSAKAEACVPVQGGSLFRSTAEVERNLVRKLDIWLLSTTLVILVLSTFDVSSSTRFELHSTFGPL